MRTPLASDFDRWIRSDFRAMNTALEEMYFAQEDRDNVEGIGDGIKQQLLAEGRDHIGRLLKEGNTDEGFDQGFELLGDVGFYMAACRRHGMTDPARETSSPLTEASALAMQLGASLGAVPRFASSHLETHNLAINGDYKTFTALADERVFLDYNTRGVFGYIRAAEALLHTLPLGISHPVTHDLLGVARAALQDVRTSNGELFAALDMQRFFFCIRPYYKPHRVGLREYRGANAGDFAGINVIDLLLGLCRADDPYYSQLLVDKFLFMRPQDQLLLRDCMRRKSLLNSFLEELGPHGNEAWFQRNLQAFLAVCDEHGRVARQHHEQLVEEFIVRPAAEAGLEEKADLSASGPPLPVLLKGLKTLCDLRCAAARDDIPSRYRDIDRLRAAIHR